MRPGASPVTGPMRAIVRPVWVIMVASAVLTGACRAEEPGKAPPTTSTSIAAPSSPTGTATDGTGVLVEVYEVGTTPQGERLYRELRRVPDADPVRAAADAVTDATPFDPDYRSLWPRGPVAGVSVGPDAITLDVPERGWLESGGLNPGQAALAVEQMVRTLQAASGTDLPLAARFEGRPAATLLGVDVTGGIGTSPDLEVLALMSISEPAEGTVVPGDTMTASGLGSSPEGSIPWEVRDASGTVRLEGFTSADGWVDGLYPWQTDIDVTSLPAGRYTLVVSTDDPSGGEGGGATQDTRTFVRP